MKKIYFLNAHESKVFNMDAFLYWEVIPWEMVNINRTFRCFIIVKLFNFINQKKTETVLINSGMKMKK